MVAFVLWQFSPTSFVVYPLRLLVTLIHELGHGTAAILTGGEFVRFEVFSNGAGLAYTRGGIRPIIIAAGYLGTAIFGATLLWVANRMNKPQQLSRLLGLLFAMLALLFAGLALENFNILEIGITLGLVLVSGYFALRVTTRNARIIAFSGLVVSILVALYFSAGDNFLTVLIGVLSGALLLLVGQFGKRNVNLFALNFLAFVVGLNAITDAAFLFQIVSNNTSARNDAISMANEVILPAEFWALSWMLTAIVLLGASTWFTFIRRRQ